MASKELSIYTPKLASFYKRIAAFIVDAILVIVLATGFGLLTSKIYDYDKYNNIVIEKQIEYGIYVLDEAGTYEYKGNKYTVVNDLESVSEEQMKQRYTNMYKDKDFQEAYYKRNMGILIVTMVGASIALLIYEFLLPLFLKHSRTLGMRFFGVSYVTEENIDPKFKNIFIRFLIGKLAINTMIPLIGLLLIVLQTGYGIMGLIMLAGIPSMDIILILVTKDQRSAPDILAKLKPVDNSNQIYFKTKEELYKAVANEDKDTKVGKRKFL